CHVFLQWVFVLADAVGRAEHVGLRLWLARCSSRFNGGLERSGRRQGPSARASSVTRAARLLAHELRLRTSRLLDGKSRSPDTWTPPSGSRGRKEQQDSSGMLDPVSAASVPKPFERRSEGALAASVGGKRAHAVPGRSDVGCSRRTA